MEKTKEMKIKITSKETITPSSQTLPHLRTFNLSLLDQFAPSFYVPLLLFYATTFNTAGVGSCSGGNDHDCREKNKKRTETSERLKKSLSETLTRFYPLAGRMKTHASIVVDCNDEGAHYSEAQVINRSLTDLLQQPESEELAHFIPTTHHEIEEEDSSSPPPLLLLVQATFFENCDGMVLGMSVYHKVADAATIVAFAAAWGNATTLGSPDTVVPSFESNSLFPPIYPRPIDIPSTRPTKENICIARRYVFNAAKIAALRAKAASTSVQRPTRVEAVSALIWKCTVEASRLRLGELAQRPSLVAWAVNIRSRLVPPLSEHSFGNLVVAFTAQDDGGSETNDLTGFVCHLRKLSSNIGTKLLSKLKKDTGDQNDSVILGLIAEELTKVRQYPKKYFHVSRCKFQFYDINFGWGKPTWVRMSDIGRESPDVVTFADTSDGEGVEVWVSFAEKEDVAFFERDTELLAFASLNPSPLQH